MALHWSTVSSFISCPQGHLWDRGCPGIDLGAGDGKPKPVADAERKSAHWSIQGTVLASFMEDFYNEKLWQWPAALQGIVDDRLPTYLFMASKDKWIDRRETTPLEIQQNVRAGITGFLKIVKENGLLAEHAEAETLLRARLPNGVVVGGHPDLILRDGNRVTIIDGKNSLKIDNDADQLRWYAMVLKYQRGWDTHRMGFLYFRYPPDSPPKTWKSSVPWTGIVDVPHAVDGFEELERKALAVKTGLQALEFPATPSTAACQYCQHKTSCDGYKNRPRRITKKALPIVGDAIPEGLLEWD